MMTGQSFGLPSRNSRHGAHRDHPTSTSRGMSHLLLAKRSLIIEICHLSNRMCCCPSSSSVATQSRSGAANVEAEPTTFPCLSSSQFLLDTNNNNCSRERKGSTSPDDVFLWMRKTIVQRTHIDLIRSCGFCHEEETDFASNPNVVDPKRVRFEHVNVRYYSQVLGNNPACREGAPIELSWDYFDERQLHVDEFDATHRRHRNDFKLTALQRSYRLSSLGYTRQQVMEAQRSVLRAQRQRRATRAKLVSFVGRWQDRLQERTEAFYASSAISVRDHKTRRKISFQKRQVQQQPPLSTASTKS